MVRRISEWISRERIVGYTLSKNLSWSYSLIQRPTRLQRVGRSPELLLILIRSAYRSSD